MSRRVLYDTNVLLDVVAARAPFVEASAAALDLVAQGRIEGFVAGHAVTTLAYLLQREQGDKKARAALRHLLSKLKVAPTTDAGVRLALAMELDDIEDAVGVASAQEAGCTAIVTRNPQHFRKTGFPALLPEVLVAAEGDDPHKETPRS